MHMGNVPERYCSRGEQCKLYVPETGRSQKLHRYHEGDICDRCSRVMADEDLDAHQSTLSVTYEHVRHQENPESLLGWPEAEVHEVPLRQLGVEPCGSGRSPNNA